jgi:hypothetical protein
LQHQANVLAVDHRFQASELFSKGLDLVDLSAEAAYNPLLELPEDPMPQASSW